MAPLAGLLTVTPFEEPEPVPEPVTVMATFVSHAAPWLPHALTCSVCAPVAAETEALTASLSTTAVFELLSNE